MLFNDALPILRSDSVVSLRCHTAAALVEFQSSSYVNGGESGTGILLCPILYHQLSTLINLLSGWWRRGPLEVSVSKESINYSQHESKKKNLDT